jgi:hypothetical protein
MNITAGGGQFAKNGAFRFLPAASGNAYTLQGISGATSNDSGTYSYTQSDNADGLITYVESGGTTGYAYVTFTSPTTGYFYSTDDNGSNGKTDFNTGTFTMASALDPAELAFVQQPTLTTAGLTINPAVTVQVEDAYSDPLTSSGLNVTLSLGSGTGLHGTLTQATNNGVATFSNLSVSSAGTYTLKATSGALLTATSSSFNVIMPPTHLVITPEPATKIAGQSFSLVVHVADAAGHDVVNDSSTVTLSLATGPGALGGTLTANAVSGVATFSGLMLTKTGSYTLKVADGALTTATSSGFTITPDTITAHLVLVGQPAVSVSGKPLSPALVIDVKDQYGNVVTSATSPVTLSITAGSGSLTGNPTVNAVAGVATFNNAILSPVGTYTLQATDLYLPDITPVSFGQTITLGSTTTTLKASGTPLLSGQALTLTATVNSSNAPGTPRTGTITFKDGATVIGTPVSLDGNSTATLTIPTPTIGTHAYTAVYSGDTNFNASGSASQSVTVQKDNVKAVLQTSAVGTVLPGQPFTLTATLSVVAPGIGTPTGNVTFKDGTTVLGTGILDGTGTATLLTSLPTASTHSLTVAYPGDSLCNSVVSSALSQVVTKATTTTTVNSPASSVPLGQQITFTAVVAPNSPANLIPTGQVVFKDGATTLATVTLVNGQAVWTTTTPLNFGSHAITASYLGDNNDLTSVSTVYTQVINWPGI